MSNRNFFGSTVLITGSNGFVGREIIRLLTQQGAEVLAFDLPTGDITNLAAVKALFKQPVHYVFHLAAQTNIPKSKTEPYDTMCANIVGTLNVLEACRGHNSLKRLVIVSTQAAPAQESVYAASKFCAETVTNSYIKEFSVPATICRLSNVYGPGQSNSTVITSVLSQMLNGAELSIGNVNAVRDFIYVEDVATALIAVARGEKTAGMTFSIGTGTQTSIQELIDLAKQLTGFTGKLTVQKSLLRDKDQTPDLSISPELFKLTGWKAQFDLRVGLEKAIAFMREHGNQR